MGKKDKEINRDRKIDINTQNKICIFEIFKLYTGKTKDIEIHKQTKAKTERQKQRQIPTKTERHTDLHKNLTCSPDNRDDT